MTHAPVSDPVPELWLIAHEVRAFLEGQWPLWHARRNRPVPPEVSQGTCQTSALFLARVLQMQGFPAHVVQGNDPDAEEGFFDGQFWRGHAWVQCDGYIVDVTADQFGDAPVILCPADDPRFRAGADTACQDMRQIRHELAAMSLKTWKERL